MQHDLIVIGGGPGGYVCAIRAAQLGMDVALVEKNQTLGGTCVNVGCIPSKTLLDSSHKFHEAKTNLSIHGIQAKGVEIDIKKMMNRKDMIVKELTDGLNFLIKKNKIKHYNGIGTFVSTNKENIEIAIKSKNNIKAKYCVIATGSESINLPNVKVDGKSIITSDHAISLDKIPKKLAIIGSGVIGLELGSVWQRLGSEVTIIEALPSMLMTVDKQIQEMALRVFKKQGIKFLFNSTVSGASISQNKKLKIKINDNENTSMTLEADKLLVAVGRKPYTASLGAEQIGIKFNKRGRIEVNSKTLETSVPNIYAIGDVIEGGMLAHKAEEEGIMVAECLNGIKGHVNYKALPWIVYTWPEIAWVGHSEGTLRGKNIPYKTGKYMFKPNGRAKAMNESDGMVKIIAHEKNDRILGVFIIGPNASELIAEATLALEFGASSEDIARSFHAHPTLSEIMREAALDLDKRAIHA